ncbi:hypothetical protein PoB_007098600 [Plakobranchus ocellatus]|uniref:Uncharacterized protein n=1 Tax=Plakobranchus ocellatus TaxID=259542 RepID=A0AAV4DJX1_9GAST|nr:hypothetical protein PoB_007098600 [Plakobranchus ocellatus]
MSGQGAGGGARTRDRRVPADLRADSLTTVPPTLQLKIGALVQEIISLCEKHVHLIGAIEAVKLEKH